MKLPADEAEFVGENVFRVQAFVDGLYTHAFELVTLLVTKALFKLKIQETLSVGADGVPARCFMSIGISAINGHPWANNGLFWQLTVVLNAAPGVVDIVKIFVQSPITPVPIVAPL